MPKFGEMTQRQTTATRGYFLVAPFEKNVGLVDTDGKTIKTWAMSSRVFNVRFLSNGHLAALMGPLSVPSVLHGRAEIRDQENKLIWEFEAPGLHHDFEQLPGGDFLFIQESLTPKKSGLHPGICDRIIRVNGKKEITWEMDLTEFIPWKEITSEFSENERTMSGHRALCHTNSIRFRNGLLLLSLRNISRVMIVDMNTKKLIWMSPKGVFQRQHDAQWRNDDELLVFNNGELLSLLKLHEVHPSEIISLNVKTNEKKILSSTPNSPFPWMSTFLSGMQPLPNGNFWVSLSMYGQIIEVNPQGEILQRFLVHPTNNKETNASYFKSSFYETNPIR